MARLSDSSWIEIVDTDNCEYEPEITGFDHEEAYLIFNAILVGFEKMDQRRVKNMTIATFESGPKGFVPGKLREAWDCKYYDPKLISDSEKRLVDLGKHYTRIDLTSSNNTPASMIYKRIRIIGLPGRDRYYRYLTKIFYAERMDFVEIVKSMNRSGVRSLDLATKIEEEIKRITMVAR